jgi:hypothetical protein
LNDVDGSVGFRVVDIDVSFCLVNIFKSCLTHDEECFGHLFFIGKMIFKLLSQKYLH